MSTKPISGCVPSFQILLLVIFGAVRLAGCGPLEIGSVLLEVTAIKQPYNLCLPACVSMVLKYFSVDIPPQDLANETPIYRDGTTGRDLQHVVERIGFRGFLIQPPFEDLLDHLRKGRPPIVAFLAGGESRHAMVVIGFDAGRQKLFFNDPASGKRISMDYKTFQKKWQAANRWTFLIVPK